MTTGATGTDLERGRPVVTPKLTGVTLEHRLRQGPLSLRSTLRVGIDVLSALEEAHGREERHGDVRPARIGIDQAEPVERATLIDAEFAPSRSPGTGWAGTAQYLAPEAAGLLPGGADKRSDLYSLGIVLFECLAGKPPFDGAEVGKVLQQQLSTPVPHLGGFGAEVPRALDAGVQRLLRKDPDERYQSAGAARADLIAIDESLRRGVRQPSVVIGRHDRRQVLTEAAFVGRDAELIVLGHLIDGARACRGGLVLLEAESGGGKTRLLDELAQQCQATAWVLRGQGVEHSAQRPFQLLEGVVAGVVAAGRDRPAIAASLRGQLGDQGEAVLAAVPDLGAVLGPIGAVDLGPEAFGEARTIDALSCLLDALGSAPALGSASRPAVVVLDDCQWADAPTLRLLARWQDRVDQRGSPLVVIAAFRSEEVPEGHPLRALDRLAQVVLDPFTTADVRSLAESMAGPLPEEVLATIASLSEGSPFMASAVLRGLVEGGALVATPTGWTIDHDRLDDVQTSRRAALFLLHRLELLAPATLDLLSSGAVLGKEFDLGQAIELSGQDRRSVAAALTEATARHIVWVDERSQRARLLHDKLRDALLSRLESGPRRRLHLRAAEHIEALHPDRVFELAYHFDAAGESGRALPYAVRAAEQARAQHSLDVAAAHYRMAWRAPLDADAATRARVAEGLGDVLTLQGSYEEATRQLAVALSLAVTDVGRASLGGKMGDVAFKRGDQRSARGHVEGALRQLHRHLPARAPAMFASLVREVLVQVAHTVAPRVFLARRTRDGADREFLAIHLYSRLAYIYWFSAGKVPCAWAHLREMNLAERYPPSPELAQAYSEHGPAMTMLPWFTRGMAYVQRSLAIRRDLGDRWGQGQSLSFYGMVLYAASRYEESIENCLGAVRLLDRTGDRWEANAATWHVGFARYRLGDLTGAVAILSALQATALDIGDQAAAGISLSGWPRASGGQVPAELVRAQLDQNNDDAHTATELHVAEGARLLSQGLWSEAVAVLEAGAAIVRRAGLRQAYVAPVFPWLATALRSQAEALSPFEAHQRRALLRRGGRVARRGCRMARHYRNNLPHALRERALLLALSGKDVPAQRLLSQSLSVAERQQARYEHALSRLAWGRTGQSLGTVGAEDVRRQAEADIAALLPPASSSGSLGSSGPANLSLADRFASLLVVGRLIASAPSPVAVYAAVKQAAETLLRGEGCHVFEVNGPPRGEAVDALCDSLVAQALEVGGAVVLADQPSVDSADNLALSGLRSALCAPIFCAGNAVACVYVTHNHVDGLFGDDEIQLVEFIATLAGAALEHVAGTEARFRSLAQNASDVITIIDRNATIVYQSAAITRVFGFDPARLAGHPLAEWLHPDDAAHMLGAVDAIVHDRQASGLVECRLLHQDGSWHHVETALNNLLDDPGINGVVLNSRDISDRKRAEHELRVTLDREHQMRESLQELDRVKTDFISSVSHELRTPLTSILGYVEMLIEGSGGPLADEQARVLAVVDRNAHRLLILIEELLLISKVESGTFRLSVGVVSLPDLINGAYQAVVPELMSRDLHVSVDVAPGTGTFEGDAGQLDRVMINLLTNAIKFTPDGGSVSVSARSEGGAVIIEVADSGIGIPAEDLPRIFERFFRSPSTQHLAVPGTGLGLSITKAIIEEHGGAIAVVSRSGEGTEVTVTLPFRSPATAGPDTPNP